MSHLSIEILIPFTLNQWLLQDRVPPNRTPYIVRQPTQFNARERTVFMSDVSNGVTTVSRPIVKDIGSNNGISVTLETLLPIADLQVGDSYYVVEEYISDVVGSPTYPTVIRVTQE